MPPAAEALPAKYKPADHESAVRSRWDASGAFHADPDRVLSGEREAYSIFIPPPNVTARLHLGHALNNTLQDILARVHRMRGFEVLWMPGTDHAGIATQAVVENRLRTEGKIKGPLRESMPREEFVAQVQAWKDEYERVITDQLKTIGCSCDWARQRFTMDEVCARAVREAFFILFRDGLIYRGKRLVNWDPATQTALADDEVEMEEVDGFFYYLRYPLVDSAGKRVTWATLAQRGYPGAASQPQDQGAWVTVATTRPETYLGDTAVGVNPKDPRAAALRGLRCALPIVARVIPIVEDDYVVMPAADPSAEGVDPKAKFATGFLKVTPAHDTNDYDLGRRHSLDIINVMAPDASISDKHGWNDIGGASMFLGLTREKARERVLEEFKKLGLLEKVTPYRHSVGHSYRSHVPIEPYLSDQWYCRVTDDRMRGSALRAMAEGQRSAASSSLPLLGGMGVPAGRVSRAPGRKEEAVEGVGTGVTPIPPRGGRKDNADPAGDGGLTFFPDRYAKMYESWHENLRDWCISRQLWWGHRIPVWSGFPINKQGTSELSAFDTLIGEWAAKGRARVRSLAEGENLSPGTPFFVAIRDPLGEDRPLVQQLETAWQFRQDPDVLDTWFSSALWPMSTLGWPEPKGEMKGLLEAFNPSAVLATAREIITLWVSRMVMFNRYFLGGPALRAVIS